MYETVGYDFNEDDNRCKMNDKNLIIIPSLITSYVCKARCWSQYNGR